MKAIYDVLRDLHIAYKSYKHPAVFTVSDAQKYDVSIDAGHTKNLFLTNKSKSRYYLVITESSQKIDLKKLATHLGENRLSFGSSEKMHEYLGVTPGSVSPFGLIHDRDHVVSVIVDRELLNHARIGFHPNTNTETLVVSSEDFKRYLEWTGNAVEYYAL